MDIYCPACGKKGRLDDAKIPDSGTFARCPGCRSRLWIHKTDGVNLAGETAPASTAAPQQAAGSPPDNRPPEPPVPPPEPAAGPAPIPPAQVEPPRPAAPQSPVPPAAPPFEVSPLQEHQAQQGMAPSSDADASSVRCSLCQNLFPDTDVAAFGETLVCASCKPQYVQMMKTGVSVPGAFVYGGFWIRFVAKIIDGLILGIAQGIFIVPLYIFMFRSVTSAPGPDALATFATANIFINLVSVAMGAAYTTFFIGKYQATPGKMAFSLKVVAPDGGKITYMRALGRHFAEMVSAFILAIGYIMAGFDSQKRSLHDRICATRVIRN